MEHSLFSYSVLNITKLCDFFYFIYIYIYIMHPIKLMTIKTI